MEAFDGINRDSIIKSFKDCGINLALDGKEDNLLNPRVQEKDECLKITQEVLLSTFDDHNIDEGLELREEFISSNLDNSYESSDERISESEDSGDEHEEEEEDSSKVRRSQSSNELNLQHEFVNQIKIEENMIIETTKKRILEPVEVFLNL